MVEHKKIVFRFLFLSFLLTGFLVGVDRLSAQPFSDIKTDGILPRTFCGDDRTQKSFCSPSEAKISCLRPTDNLCESKGIKFCVDDLTLCGQIQTTFVNNTITLINTRRSWCPDSGRPDLGFKNFQNGCPSDQFIGCLYESDVICEKTIISSDGSGGEVIGKSLECSPLPACAITNDIGDIVYTGDLVPPETYGYVCNDKSKNLCLKTVNALGKYTTKAACEAECVETAAAPAEQKKDQKQETPVKPAVKPAKKDTVPKPQIKIYILNNYTCVKETGQCVLGEQAGGLPFKGMEGECNVLCSELAKERSELIKEKGKSQPQPKRFSCVNREKKQCEESVAGKYASTEACLEDCKPEPLMDPKKVKKLKTQYKTQKLFYERLLEEEDTDENTLVLAEAFIAHVKNFTETIDELLKAGVTKVSQNKFLSELELLEEREATLEEIVEKQEQRGEQRKAAAPKFAKEHEARAKKEGFSDKALKNPQVISFLDQFFSVFGKEEESVSVENIKGCVENFISFPSGHQKALGEVRTKFVAKTQEVFMALEGSKVSAEDRKEFIGLLERTLKEPWSPSLEKSIELKLKQVTVELKDPKEKIPEILKDFQGFLEEKKDLNREVLFDEGRQTFSDLDPCQWYFPIFQDPKQVAFKGASGRVNPSMDVKEIEFLTALLRSIQAKNIEPDQCENPELPEGITPPEWAKCALNTACTLLNSKCVSDLRLEKGAMLIPLPREKTALFIWKMLQQEPVTKELLKTGVIKTPTTDEIKAVCEIFADCGSLKKDPEIIEAVAAMNKNNLMTGKTTTTFGFGKTLLRAEAAKILLFLGETISSAP